MKIKVEFLGHVKNLVGCDKEEVYIGEGASIADLLSLLSEKFGSSFQKAIYEKAGGDVKSNYIITVNGYLLNQLDGIKTALKNGDHVAILPIVSGG